MSNEQFVERYIKTKIQPSNEIAFDIGAHIGHYSKILSEKFKTVYAFEACPPTISKHLIPEMKLYPNVIVIPKAISDTSNRVKLYTVGLEAGKKSGENSISHLMMEKKIWGHNPNIFTEVDAITIDEFVQQNDIQNLGFIKMDIEGAENFVWNSAINTLRTHKLNIILEVHQTVNCPILFQFFYDLGYKVYDHVGAIANKFKNDEHYLITNRI